jgi:epoxyqueuosine reductase QueG
MDRIVRIIADYMGSSANRLAPDRAEPAFDQPLVGVSRADDPIWERIVGHIGPVHWRAAEAFALAFPDAAASASDLRIVSWVLPQTKATRDDHRHSKSLPSVRWSLARHYGEKVNEGLRRHLVDALAAFGVQAVAPVLLPQWGYRDSRDWGFASNWSERHAAFAAGLGTFGLSDGLITARGKAVRIGSVVAAMNLEATPRPYGEDHHAYCLHYRKGTCRACAKRCPAKTISSQGHDKPACKGYVRGTASPFVEREQLGFPVNSCGLCQTGVPCEDRIPLVKSLEEDRLNATHRTGG